MGSYVETESLDVGMGGDALLLRRRLHLLDPHHRYRPPPQPIWERERGGGEARARPAGGKGWNGLLRIFFFRSITHLITYSKTFDAHRHIAKQILKVVSTNPIIVNS